MLIYKKVLLRERKRHTAHRIASIPSVVLAGGRELPHPRTGDTLPWGTPSPHPDQGGTPSQEPGVLTHPHLVRGYPGKDMRPVEVLWDGDGVPPLDVDRHTPVKTVPFRRNTYAGGNK